MLAAGSGLEGASLVASTDVALTAVVRRFGRA